MVLLLAAIINHKLVSPQRKTETRLSGLQESSHNLRGRVPMLPDGLGTLTRLPSTIRSEEDTNPELLKKKTAIEKCIAGLLPSQLASHLSREPPKSLAELYSEVEKYARSDADHRRRVEQRKLMRQQQGWP